MFLETDTELSKQVLFGKMSEVLRKRFTNKNGELNSDLYDQDIMNAVHKLYPDASQDVIAELMKKGYIEESIIKQGLLGALQYTFMAFHAIPKATGWLLKKIGEGIDLLKIDDKLWDTENETYFLKKENFIAQLSISTESIKKLEDLLKAKEGFDLTDIAPSFITEKAQEFLHKLKNIIGIYNSLVEQQVDEFYNTLNNPVGYILFQEATESFAFFAGIWNGVVDFLSGIFHFAGDILQAPFDQVSDFQTTLENFDNFCDAVWSADFWNNLWEGIKAIYHKIKQSLKSNNSEDYNWVRIAYFSGFGLATIASFFIPVAQLTNLAKAGKFGPLIAKFTQEISAGAAKATAVVTEKGKQAQQAVVKIFSEILDVISAGGTKLKKFFENIWQKIVDWFLKNKKTISLIEKADDAILPFIKILKQNSWYLKSLKLVEGPITNGKHGRQLGQWLAVESEAMVKLYTSFWYEKLNEALYNGTKLSKELKAMKEVLDNALLKLPVFNQKGNALLRSAFHSEKEIAQMFKVGKEWVSKGFFSTTHSKQSLLSWLSKKPHHNVIFKVYGKNGKLIEKAAYKIEEHEVLFKSGTTFLVESVEKGFDYKLGREITEIILKEK